MIVKAAVQNTPQKVAESVTAAPPRARAASGPLMTWLFSSTALSQSLGLYLPATVAFRLINFGRILLLTWWMSRQQFGLLNMILLALNVLTPLCSLGLNEAVTRYVPQYEARGSLRHFLQQSIALLLIAMTVSIAVLWSFSERCGVFFYAQVFTDAKWLAEFRVDAPELTRLSAVVIGLLIIYFYLLAVMKGLRMFTALSIMEMFHGVIFLAASVIAIATRHLSALTLTGVYGISLLVPIAVFGVGLLVAVSHRTIEERRPTNSNWSRSCFASPYGRLLRVLPGRYWSITRLGSSTRSTDTRRWRSSAPFARSDSSFSLARCPSSPSS